MKDAEREAEYWKTLALDDDETPPAAPTPPVTPVADGRPIKAQFETPEQYEDAVYDWRKGKESSKFVESEKQQKGIDDLATFNKNAEDFRKEHADFNEIIERPVFNDTMREVLLTAEDGPALTYYIGKNPAVSDHLKTLTPSGQIYEIGKIAQELKAGTVTVPISGAPPPLEPVGGEGVPEKDPSKMPITEWMAWNKANEIEKIKAKLGTP